MIELAGDFALALVALCAGFVSVVALAALARDLRARRRRRRRDSRRDPPGAGVSAVPALDPDARLVFVPHICGAPDCLWCAAERARLALRFPRLTPPQLEAIRERRHEERARRAE